MSCLVSRRDFRPASCDRREFLSAAALLAAGTLVTPLRGFSAETGWQLRLCGSTINFSRLSIEKACERIAALGFEAVDIWSAHAGCPHLDDALNRLGAAGLKDLLAKTNLKLNAFSVYSGGYPKYAKLLGESGGGLAIRGSAEPCESKDLTARMKDFLEALKPEIELAEKYDSYLAIENHGTAILDSVDSLHAFVDGNKSKRLGIALAPYHIQARRESVVDAIEACGSQLLYFYAWQHADGLAQLPGIGPADCCPWLDALRRVGFSRYANPFLHNEPAPDEVSEALKKSCDYLKHCLSR